MRAMQRNRRRPCIPRDCGFPAALVSRIILGSVRRARTAFLAILTISTSLPGRRGRPPSAPYVPRPSIAALRPCPPASVALVFQAAIRLPSSSCPCRGIFIHPRKREREKGGWGVRKRPPRNEQRAAACAIIPRMQAIAATVMAIRRAVKKINSQSNPRERRSRRCR